MRIFYFVGFYYIQYLFIITMGLGLFFVGIDTLKYASDLPDSANLLILFILYDFAYASGFILPISLLLSEIVVLAVLLRNNEFVALLSLGYSKAKIALPILITALLVLCLFIILNATPFAYAKEKVDNIVKQNINNRSKNELLIKYQNNYVYFNKVFPLVKKAEGIRIYTVENKKLTQLIQANTAVFMENRWHLQDVNLLTFKEEMQLGQVAFERKNMPVLEVLEGFEPKILDIIYEKSGSVSILDAFSSLVFLKNEGIDSSKIRGILYSLAVFPLFALPTLVIVLAKMPLSVRYGELGAYIFRSILISLVIWGLFFALSRFAMSGFIHPEYAFVLPILLWFIVGGIYLKRLNHYDS